MVKADLPYGWRPEKGLAYARRSPDATKRAQSLAILVDYFPDKQQEKIWQEVLAVAESIEDKFSRAQVLSDLAAKFPEAFESALSAAQAIQYGDDRAQVLIPIQCEAASKWRCPLCVHERCKDDPSESP